MNDRSKLLVPVFSFVLVISSALAQGPGSGGVRGSSSPRSGLGIRSNPIVNPAPSLTPNQVLNPRGSLSTGQVLHPAPSLRRPRSGGPTIGAQQAGSSAQQAGPSARQAGPSGRQTVASGGSTYRTRRPSTGYSTASHLEELSTQLRRYNNGESWAKYLALPKELLSDETTEDANEQVRKLLKRFDKLTSDPTYAKVTSLPAFWLAHESLKLKVDPSGTLPDPSANHTAYLSPPDAQQDLSRYLDQLGDQLREFKNGESWAKYLIPPQALVSDNLEDASVATTKLLKRFNKLSSDPTYAKVTSLIAFRPAHEALKRVADQVDPLPPPSAVANADPKTVAATDKEPAANADKKPDPAANKKSGPGGDKKAVVANDQKPAKPLSPPASVSESVQPISTDPAAPHPSVGERVLKSVVALEARIAKVAVDKGGWQKRLSLADLEVGVTMTSDQPASDSDRKSLEKILETYQAIAKDKDATVVNQLPEFKQTLEALQEYVKPLDAQPPQD